MKVLSPLNTEHEIVLIPRYYSYGSISLELLNEYSDELFTYELTPVISGGYLYLNFTQAFDNNSNFRIKVIFEDEIIYRGKLFVTDQSDDLQDYKITKDIFTL